MALLLAMQGQAFQELRYGPRKHLRQLVRQWHHAALDVHPLAGADGLRHPRGGRKCMRVFGGANHQRGAGDQRRTVYLFISVKK